MHRIPASRAAAVPLPSSSSAAAVLCPLCRSVPRGPSGFCQPCSGGEHGYSTLVAAGNRNARDRFLLLAPQMQAPSPIMPRGARGLGWVPTLVRGVLKIRYLLLGGALGGGYTLSKVREIN